MNEQEYRNRLTALLKEQGLMALRRYGRDLQLTRTADVKKDELVEKIVAVLCGEVTPKRGRKGAPVKDGMRETRIAREVSSLRKEFGLIDEEAELTQEKTPPTSLSFTVTLDKLTSDQKRILTDFINSFCVSVFFK